MNTKPTVSVYICTYNRAQLLKRAIQSVLSQSYGSFEIVVCSDNSTDSTDLLMKNFTDEFSNIKYYKLPTNSGACAARNKAIENCTGKYITGLDDDDYFEDNRLEAFIHNANLLKKYSFLSSSYKYKTRKNVKDILMDDRCFTINDIVMENNVGNQVFTLRTNFLAIGGFDSKLPAWQDHDVWIRLISEYGPGKRIPDATYVIDVSHEHERISKSDEKIKLALKLILKKYSNKPYFHLMRENLTLNFYSYPQAKLDYALAFKLFKKRGLRNTISVHIKKILRAIGS
ncbi:glycosyltransferase [Vibrio neonatus]|uniref:glycosyltransferase n=1 Tax=Vibrio neonatus TaxID=278860 RepID=UPI0021C3CFBE|nr:glycosyltransferase [Vibrio neonatus]